jgi:hypothetical protein
MLVAAAVVYRLSIRYRWHALLLLVMLVVRAGIAPPDMTVPAHTLTASISFLDLLIVTLVRRSDILGVSHWHPAEQR